MSRFEWKLLTKKRESATKGVPPGKEALAWVTNTVTLIYGERDAVLVDTFLFEQRRVDSDHCVTLPPSWRSVDISTNAESRSRRRLFSRCWPDLPAEFRSD